jgi:formate hydrogenlyase subunit 6/NADH:ubiquinone oxidoreductase subunit I
MLDNLLQSGAIIIAVWVVFAALSLYLVVAVWSHLSADKLFWQNIFGSNRVALPLIARNLLIPDTSSNNAENQALVLVRGEDSEAQDKSSTRGVIYPLAGRNGLHFAVERCTSCQLCSYVCPAAAVTTQDSSRGYIRSFDLTACIYCGLCEAACPTQAIKLTVNQSPARKVVSTFKVQGEVDKKPCPKCSRKVPQIDLMAERIYNLEASSSTTIVIEANTTPEAATSSDEGISEGRKFAQAELPCTACQQAVLVLEEKICC